jgi:uncharacterized protein YlbG (UPF0298 family)
VKSLNLLYFNSDEFEYINRKLHVQWCSRHIAKATIRVIDDKYSNDKYDQKRKFDTIDAVITAITIASM